MDNNTTNTRYIKNIYTYWEGHKPLYIEKCLNSIISVCSKDFTVTLLTPENIDKFLNDGDLNPNYKLLQSIAHKADCIRIAIMWKYGGIWVDADTVFLKSPLELTQYIDNVILIQKKEFFYFTWNDGRILNGYFICTQKSKILESWLLGINNKLITLHKEYEWTEFGEQIIMPLVFFKKELQDLSEEIDRFFFIPINIDKIPHVFFERVKMEGFLPKGYYSIALNHSFFLDHYRKFVDLETNEELTKGDLLINDIMKYC